MFYKETDNDGLGKKLPSGWKDAKLGKLVEDMFYGITAKAVPKETGLRMLRTTDITNYEINWKTLPFCEITDSRNDVKRYLLRKNDLIVARAGTTGVSVLVDRDSSDTIFGSYLIKLALKPELNPKFAHYFFQSNLYWEHIERNKAGSTLKNIKLPILNSLPMALPSMKEQLEIAKVLSTVDDAIQKSNEIVAKSERLRKGLMQDLLAKGIGHRKFKRCELGQIPEEWSTVELDKVVHFQNGRFFPSEDYSADGIKLLRPGNLHPDGFLSWNAQNTQYLPLEYASKASEWIVRGREIVMNLTAQSLEDEFLGRVCLTEDDEYCLLNQRLARITSHNIDVAFLFLILRSQLFRKYVDRLPGGTKIKHIYTRDLGRFVLPLPSLDEQKRIDAIIFDIAKAKSEEEQTLAVLATVKSGLMQLLLTGKVRVKVN